MSGTLVAESRGRILSKQQVRFSDSPVRLGSPAPCQSNAPSVSMRKDPATGDLVAIIVQCGCGEVTVVECKYESSDGSH